MAQKYDIKGLADLLQPTLQDGQQVASFTTKSLIAAGENYGSLMLAVTATLRTTESGEESTLHVVAKLPPPNDWLKKMFNIPVTFKREIAMYNVVIPTLKTFQLEQGLLEAFDGFPASYAARISLDPTSDTVDDDAVLLLENLKVSGYDIADRMKGFDLKSAEVVIKDLAVFHAIPIALKVLRPDVFKAKIMPHLKEFKAFESVADEVKTGMKNGLLSVARENPETAELERNLSEGWERANRYWTNPKIPREPFATICHNDFWVNNVMIKYQDASDVPVSTKIIDFQLADYDSLAKDVIFFLFSSVRKSVLDDSYDNLINLYYSTFIDTLEKLKCDTRPFTYELFLEELTMAATCSELVHVLVMLQPIYTLKGQAKELSELEESDMTKRDNLSELYRPRLIETILDFHKHKWL